MNVYCIHCFLFFYRRDHARTKLSLTPSILQKKSFETTPSASVGDKASLKNDDFRKMLLGGK